MTLAVPSERLLVGPVMRIRGTKYRIASSWLQKMRRITPFIKTVLGYEDGVIVADRPKAVIEEPVGCLGKRDAIRGSLLRLSRNS